MLRLAALSDLAELGRVYDSARSFMRSCGNFSQWSGGKPSASELSGDIEAGRLFVLEDDGRIYGAFTFSLCADPTYAEIDGGWLSDEPYGVIHRVASDGSRRGVLRSALDFALEKTSHLRMDTHRDNLVMQRHLKAAGFVYCGIIRLEDGSPRLAYELTSRNVRSVTLPRRELSSHKGNFGRVLIIAGSRSYTGAPSFASHGAVRAGAGLVFLGVPEAIYSIEAVKNDEAMVFPLPSDEKGRLTSAAIPEISERLEKCDVCLIGPGLGLSEDTFEVVYSVIESAKCPVICDADGITAVSRNINILDRAAAPVILTPHEGEFLRLGGDLTRGRVKGALAFAEKTGAITCLKGCGTVTAFPDGELFINTTGNPGMAKGGSGDVLAGIMAGLVPQLVELKKAVPAAVYLHGRAADLAAEALGEYAMTPSDILGQLPFAMR